ncbi:MAG: arylsulfatase [Verrucomicrobiota bacterium]
MSKAFYRYASALWLLLATGAPGERPNILVIMTDDMGYSDLGCYGGEIATPNLDALAAGGIRYTQMYNTSKCWTTRISLLTGRYHQRSGRGFEHTALAGEVLRPAGYRTWWSGKHHADFNPHGRGFDHFSGFLGGAINFWNPGNTAREGEAAPGWGATYTWAFDQRTVKPFVPGKRFYATDTFTDWALEWLDEKRGADEPFFLYVAYNAPHWPLHAHAEDIAKYAGVYDAGYEAIRKARYARQLAMGLFDAASTPLSPPEHADWKALPDAQRKQEALRMQIHAAMVDRVDQNVGRLVAALKAQDAFENTLIFFLVDNGASHERPSRGKKDPEAPWGTVGSFEAIGQSWANAANSPLRKWKVQGLEGGINTPMIAHWPRGIRAGKGSICREPSHLVDLLPTWMELAGKDAVYPAAFRPLDGISLVPTLHGKALKRGRPLFFQYGSWQVIRDGKWKLAQAKSGPWELYDLSTDRTETRNRAGEYPERVADLKEQWHAWYRACTGKDWKGSAGKTKKTPKPRRKK